jgi:hypothetical protein
VSRRGNAAVLLTALALMLPAACAGRVAPYDETIASGLAGLQASNDRFFARLEQTAGTVEAEWPSHVAWYDEMRVEIGALRLIASQSAQNDATVDALGLLARSIDELEKAHGAGLSPGEIPVLRTLFDSQLRMLIQLEAAKKRIDAAEVSP